MTQWVLELEGLKKREQETFEAYATTFKKILVSVLGLNLIRPADEKGVPKAENDMTQEEKDAFLPMVAWCGRDDILKSVADQIKTQVGIEEAKNPDSEYEKMVEAIDAAGGDMEPLLQDLDGKSLLSTAQQQKLDKQKKLLGIQDASVDVEGKV